MGKLDKNRFDISELTIKKNDYFSDNDCLSQLDHRHHEYRGKGLRQQHSQVYFVWRSGKHGTRRREVCWGWRGNWAIFWRSANR